jgi:hypothetical protein
LLSRNDADGVGSATVSVAPAGVSPASRTIIPPTPSGEEAGAARVFGETPKTAVETVALVRLRMSVHRRVEVPLWRCFPPRVESNCVLARGRGEQLETKG